MPNTNLSNGGVILGNDTTAAGTATTAEFNRLLKKYSPYSLMAEEAKKRDYFLSKVNIKDGWKGGQMDIPFKAAKASSRRFGKLVKADEINKAKYGIGAITKYKELWGAMVFDDHDLLRHDNMEQSFIKILPDQLEDFVTGMKEEAGRNFLNRNAISRITANPTHLDPPVAAAYEAALTLGVLEVTRPENFELGQRVEVGVVRGIKGTGYVQNINVQDHEIELHTTYAGGTPLDMSILTGIAVDSATFDICAIQDGLTASEVFTSLDDQLLSLANGGSAEVFGVPKTAYPYTQSFNFDGSGISTGADLIKKIFESMLLTKRIGKGAPTEALMSHKLLAGVMSSLQNGLVSGSNSQGPQYFLKDTKASLYGWTEIEVIGVEGSLKLVGINEMEDDTVKILDWRGIDLHTNGLFERHSDLNGDEFYVERTEDGYKYITDVRMFGELVVCRPSYQGIIYGVPATFQV